jgi:UDP-GlcNAc:undecaprenyl-phosphate/decaprenyl-phosphate GlcNAc-1-phosphate transferase
MIAILTTPAAAVMAVTLMPTLSAWARRVRLVDVPGGRKQHVGHVPLTGGIVIYLALLSIALAAGAFDSAPDLLFLTLAGIVVIAGMADDFWSLPAWTKLAWQFAIAGLAVGCGGPALGDAAALIGMFPAWALPAVTGPILSVLLYVALMNAVNLLDGADGVAAGTAAATLAGILIIALESGVAEPRLAPIALGAVLGFLYFNMPLARQCRAQVFLGDAGSMLIGFALAWFALDLHDAARVPPAAFVWLLGLPVLDMVRVALGRLRRGVSPFAAGREHLHHLLLAAGMTPLATALTMSGVALGFAAIAVGGAGLGLGNVVLTLLFVLTSIAYLGGVAVLRRVAGIVLTTARDRAAGEGAAAQRPARLRRAA